MATAFNLLQVLAHLGTYDNFWQIFATFGNFWQPWQLLRTTKKYETLTWVCRPEVFGFQKYTFKKYTFLVGSPLLRGVLTGGGLGLVRSQTYGGRLGAKGRVSATASQSPNHRQKNEKTDKNVKAREAIINRKIKDTFKKQLRQKKL